MDNLDLRIYLKTAGFYYVGSIKKRSRTNMILTTSLGACVCCVLEQMNDLNVENSCLVRLYSIYDFEMCSVYNSTALRYTWQ